MRRWKKILSASLVAVMVGSLGMTAFAEDTSANEPIDTTVSNYNLTEEETSGKNQEEIKALQQQKIERKEKAENELLVRRSSRAGREDDTQRR